MQAAELSRRLLDEPQLEGELRQIDPFALEGQEERVAFWLNVYNARLRSELAESPRKGSVLRHRSLFRRSSYRIGELDYSLNQIEHGLLRSNARPPYSPRRLLAGDDPRLGAAPPKLDPRIHFALNCGATSCPLVRPYDPAGVDEQLEAATRAYITQESEIDRAGGGATLPGLCKLYSADFGGRDGVRRFAQRYLGEDLDGLRLRFAAFDWTLVP